MQLDKKIEEYSDELFKDLGLVNLPEEKKAEVFARLEDHLNQAILTTLKPILAEGALKKVETALDEENYRELATILGRYPQHAAALETMVQQEFNKLKVTLESELKNAQE